MDLFPCRSDSAVKHGQSGNWRQTNRYHRLTDQEIFETLQASTKLFRAHQFDTKTRYLVLRISHDSNLFNLDSIVLLRKQLQALSIDPRHYQFDDDWYLYILFSDWIDSTQASSALSEWLRQRSYEIGPGGLQIYPTNGVIPFPLQVGFSWLNEYCQTIVHRNDLSIEEALSLFLSDLDKNAVDPVCLLQRIENYNPTSHNVALDEVEESLGNITQIADPFWAPIVEESHTIVSSGADLGYLTPILYEQIRDTGTTQEFPYQAPMAVFASQPELNKAANRTGNGLSQSLTRQSSQSVRVEKKKRRKQEPADTVSPVAIMSEEDIEEHLSLDFDPITLSKSKQATPSSFPGPRPPP